MNMEDFRKRIERIETMEEISEAIQELSNRIHPNRYYGELMALWLQRRAEEILRRKENEK